MSRGGHKTKKVPTYWWDFGKEGEIIVESDSARFPVVARFSYDPNGGAEPRGVEKVFLREMGSSGKIGSAASAIEQAEAYIAELQSGRADPRKGLCG